MNAFPAGSLTAQHLKKSYGKREVVKDLEYWARMAGAYTERRRIRSVY